MSDYEQAPKRARQDNPGDVSTTTASGDVTSVNSDLMREANEALQESNRIHVRPIVDETKLGIELFVGDRKHQFHGIIKARYADFIVHEIDLDDNIAELTVLDAPEESEQSSKPNIEDLINSKDMECITEVNNGYLNQYKIDVSGMDKDKRTALHQAIRDNFDRLESSTICDIVERKPDVKNGSSREETDSNESNRDMRPDSTQHLINENDQSADSTSPSEQTQSKPLDRKYILVTRRNKMSRPKNIWPKNRPDYTHFLLYKENKDTMDAIYCLAGSLNQRPSGFSSAGVKDRRAVTTQWVSCWRLEPRRLLAAVRRYNKHPFIKVGNFCFKKEPLRIGQLKGNKFDIVVRNLIHNSQGANSIEQSINDVREKGFINYFGLQRFGTRTVQTHEIGLSILQGEWEKAVDSILSYRYDDNMQPPPKKQETSESASPSGCGSNNPIDPMGRVKSDSNRHNQNDASQHNAFIDLWKSKLDADTVFKKYPHFRYSNEGVIMKYLSKSEESSRDYMNALISLPRGTRSMYVHSYQSLIWNKAVSYRLQKHGFKVIPGDLILSNNSNITDNSLDLLLSADENADTLNDSVSKQSEAKRNNNNNNDDERKVPIEDLESQLIVATEKNLHLFTIFDVVLPIVGSRIKLPQNDVGLEIERLIKKDNLTLDCFRTNERLFISFGSYRKIMVKPKNVNHRIEQYSHPQQNLVETDIDRLVREMKLKDVEGGTGRLHSVPTSDSSDEAMIIEFELPPSSYATMCLREIMKQPSTDFNKRF